MFRARSIQSSLSIKDKIISIDYILVISIFILGLTSILAMYSTDGGEILFHTQNHFFKLVIFFPLMILVAFFNIKFWHNFSYIIYFLVILYVG